MSTRQKVRVTLTVPLSEMAREEVTKQIAFLAKGISDVTIPDAQTIEFQVDADHAAGLGEQARALAERMQRSLRNLQRKVTFRSPAMDAPQFKGDGKVAGIGFEADGICVLEGLPLKLFEYFNRCFTEFGRAWRPSPMQTPTLIPASVLSRCDYFRSFPHAVTFACHLPEDPACIEDFRQRHHTRETLDDRAIGQMVTPEACLSPAVCYHVYYANRERTLPSEGLVYSIVGKCFRYESANMRNLVRLWDFTMRELVFLGDREPLLHEQRKGEALFREFLVTHDLAGEIRTASDPFFVAPDSAAKTYFQISSETKLEISLLLPENARLAVGSFNYHGDFFGKAFQVKTATGGPMHSVCFAWGLERWVYAFLVQHGDDPRVWPSIVRNAPEFAS
jgi:seryl-tRNA synthetase